MDLTPREIQEKQFHDVFRGYSHEEVDLFLDEVAESFDRVFRENQTFHHRLRDLEEQLTTARATEDMLKRTLISAQKTAEEAVTEARVSANETVAEAERTAEKLIADAERRAGEIVDAATRRGRELEVSVEGMKRFEQEYRARLQAFIESQLRVLSEGPVPPEMPSSMPAETPASSKPPTVSEAIKPRPAERPETPSGVPARPTSPQASAEQTVRFREAPKPASGTPIPANETQRDPRPAAPGTARSDNGQPPSGSEAPRAVPTGAARPEVRVHSTEAAPGATADSPDKAPESKEPERIDAQVQAAIRRAGEMRPGAEPETERPPRDPGSFVNTPRPQAPDQPKASTAPRPTAEAKPTGSGEQPSEVADLEEEEFEDEASIKKLFWGEE